MYNLAHAFCDYNLAINFIFFAVSELWIIQHLAKLLTVFFFYIIFAVLLKL